LEASRRIRELLSEELGIDPSPALQDLERKILRQESVDPPPADATLANATPAMLQTVSDTAVVLSAGRLVLPTGEEYPVPSRGLRIGRMDDNDLVIENSKVSRYHAVVAPMGKGFAVNDLRSTNGITVGEQRVLDSHVLRDGDVIAIGGLEMVFRLGE
jgi:pSer/pThr/pTyr-binding forkhead associated (FHA) protein